MKRFLLTLLILLGIGGGIGVYYWQQMTQIPGWATSSTPQNPVLNPRDRPQITQARQTLQTKIQTALQQPQGHAIEVQLDASDLNTLLATELTNATTGSPAEPALQSVSTRISHGKVQTGAVIDLGLVPDTTNDPRTRWLQALKSVPGLGDRPVYVGLEGNFSIQNQQLRLTPETRITLGGIQMSLTEAARRFGLSPDTLQQQIERELNLRQFDGLSSVEIVGDRVIVRAENR